MGIPTSHPNQKLAQSRMWAAASCSSPSRTGFETPGTGSVSIDLNRHKERAERRSKRSQLSMTEAKNGNGVIAATRYLLLIVVGGM
jgi:hypothetical protein